MVNNSTFGGVSVGLKGPVHPIIAEDGARRDEAIVARQAGWYGAKTLWYAVGSYSGPVLIRGQRLDGPGSVTFGEGPTEGFLAGSGSAAGRGGIGLRTWPGGTWVRSPGCYGFQVDGASFSYVITLQVRSGGHPRRG